MKETRGAAVIGNFTLYLPAPILQVKKHCLACHKICHLANEVHLGKNLHNFSNILILCFVFEFFEQFIL